MNGIHDMGGMHGFGPINPEPDEPVFHHEWEKRAFGMSLAIDASGYYDIDTGRHGIERVGHVAYLARGYYDNWMSGVTILLLERGIITQAELDAKYAQLAAEAA